MACRRDRSTKVGPAPNRRGTTVTFHPDPEIFGHLQFKPARLLKMARSKAYLFSGVEIRWKSAISDGETPAEAVFHFPGGLGDYLSDQLSGTTTYADRPFAGKVGFPEKFNVPGSVEWAINWTPVRDGFLQSYCNTVPTPEGGTHEAGFWSAILKGVRAYGERVKNRKAELITRDDMLAGGCAVISIFIREPQFVGQTKDRLATEEAARLVEGAVRDHFDTWLAADTKSAGSDPRFPDPAGRGAAEAPRREGDAAQDRHQAAAPAGQAGRLQRHRARGDRAVHRRGRQRGRQRQDGARPHEPGAAAAARQDPERARGGQRQDGRERRDQRPLPGAWRRHGHEVQHRRPAL